MGLNEALERLCTALEEELERQELVLRLCTAQEEALSLRDPEMLMRRTAALNQVLQDVADAEEHRLAATREVVEMLEIPTERQTLTGLAGAAPAPYGRRLAEVQARLQQTMKESAVLVRRNHRVLRRMLVKSNDTLRALYGAAETQGNYTNAGQQDAPMAGAALLNQAG